MSAVAAEDASMDATVDEVIVEIEDERTALAGAALDLLRRAFPPRERQPIEQIAMEVGEKRLGLLTSYDFHLFAAVRSGDRVVAVASGVYLGGVNSGFVTYLAVAPAFRGRLIGRRLRGALVEAFRRDALGLEWPDLAAVVGEVRLENPWLRRLVRDHELIPLDLRYFHPGQDPSETSTPWVLYRQPIADPRAVLSAHEVRQLLYAIWRRAYRVRWPLEREPFHRMLTELADRREVGAHPGVSDQES